MKNKQDLSLQEWGKQFSSAQKKAAQQANNYYEVVAEFKRARKELGLTQQAVADRIDFV